MSFLSHTNTIFKMSTRELKEKQGVSAQQENIAASAQWGSNKSSFRRFSSHQISLKMLDRKHTTSKRNGLKLKKNDRNPVIVVNQYYNPCKIAQAKYHGRGQTEHGDSNVTEAPRAVNP